MNPLGDPRKLLGDLQERISKIKEDAASVRAEATAGGGMVRAVANGKMEIVALEIEKGIVHPDQVEMVQDLTMAAVNEALRRAQAEMTERLKSLAGGLPIPQIPGLFGGG